jgi:hypothetical protein
MKNDEEISTADSAQIESLIERVKQGMLEQNDAQLIERLLRAFLALITLLQRKNTTIKRLKQLFLGPQEKKGKGQSDATNRTDIVTAVLTKPRRENPFRSDLDIQLPQLKLQDD